METTSDPANAKKASAGEESNERQLENSATRKETKIEPNPIAPKTNIRMSPLSSVRGLSTRFVPTLD